MVPRELPVFQEWLCEPCGSILAAWPHFPLLGGCCCQGVSFVALPDRGARCGLGVFWSQTGAQRWGGPWGEDFCSQQGVIFCLGEQLPIPYKLFLSVTLGALTFIPCGEWEVILFAISFCSAALLARTMEELFVPLYNKGTDKENWGLVLSTWKMPRCVRASGRAGADKCRTNAGC